MSRRVNVIGVGMVKFQKPGASEDYTVMASKAARAALADAGVEYGDVEEVYAGSNDERACADAKNPSGATFFHVTHSPA
jgi:3-hydroxy-3-methylglutaryl CoA synthase